MAALSIAGCQGEVTDRPWRPGGPTAYGPATPPPALARRLTTVEYDYTVRDLLGIELSDDDLRALPVDLPIGGFVNTAQGQATLPENVLAYDRLATRITELLDMGSFVGAHAPCTETADASCREGFARSAGELLFRRPTTDDEVRSFAALHDAVAAEGGGFEEACASVLRAMLQSPQFLYVLAADAPDGDRVVRDADGYELASRLSYFLWRSAPDEELLRAAADGELSEAENLRAQAERLLDDPRAERATEEFIVDWARLRVLPDPDGQRADLVRSTVAFYQRYLWENDGALAQLWTEPSAVLTPELASAYGLEPEGDGLAVYDLSALEGRAGLLTQPGVMAGMTNADGGQIVARGLFLQAQLFCSEPPSPPANLDEIIEEFLGELPENPSDRLVAEVRLERPECGECHSSFDPLAYAFERFDFRGAYRLEDEHGNALVTDGWIPAQLVGGEDRPYEGVDDYVGMLAEHPAVQRCFVTRNVQYALGTALDEEQEPAIRRIAYELERGPGDYRQLVATLVQQEIFRQVRLDREAP